MNVRNLVPKKVLKQIERDIEKAFSVHFNRVQIPIMDIPVIYSHATDLILKGASPDEVLKNMAEEYKAQNARPVATNPSDSEHATSRSPDTL